MRAEFRILIVAVVICSAGCAERRAQTVVQTGLTGLAEVLDATDSAVATRLPEAAEAAREEVLRSHPAASPEALLAAYLDLIDPWLVAITAMEAVQGALSLAQSGVTIWIQTGALGGSWGRFCNAIGGQIEELVAAINALGVITLPSGLSSSGPMLTTVCTVAGSYFTSPSSPNPSTNHSPNPSSETTE